MTKQALQYVDQIGCRDPDAAAAPGGDQPERFQITERFPQRHPGNLPHFHQSGFGRQFVADSKVVRFDIIQQAVDHLAGQRHIAGNQCIRIVSHF